MLETDTWTDREDLPAKVEPLEYVHFTTLEELFVLSHRRLRVSAVPWERLGKAVLLELPARVAPLEQLGKAELSARLDVC